MRAGDIVEALTAWLPGLVDDFTDNVNVVGITNQGYAAGYTTFLVTTQSKGNAVNGDNVFLTGIYNPLTVDSFTRVGVLGTIVTNDPHDITLGSQPTVTTSGAVEAVFNGTFTITSIPDRYTIKVVMDDAGALTATGTVLALDARSRLQQLTGLQEVASTPSPLTFTYKVPFQVTGTPALVSAKAKFRPRISSSAAFSHFLEHSYTPQKASAAWLCVVLGDGVASKSRQQGFDATDNIQIAQFYNQKVVQTVDLHVIIPSTASIGGREPRDRCEELLRPICLSVLMKPFDGLSSAGVFNPLQFVSHGMAQYAVAYYAHRYTFEMTTQLTQDDTAVGNEIDVAFRDITINQLHTTGTENMQSDINLDDEI